jgi:biotin-dependent carboxylase-like uncharacterized protein
LKLASIPLNSSMTELKLHFRRAGLYTSIQDSGRKGVQHLGIPIGGAMDLEAMQEANHLVGNAPNTPVIEITLQGPEIHVEGEGQIAFAGAYFKGKINNRSLPFYQTIKVKTGDIINLEGAIYGCRTYLAVRGALAETEWLGSQSAVSPYLEGFGLESHFKNDKILCFETKEVITKRKIAKAKHPIHSECAVIRTITGPDFEHFPIEVIQAFYDQVFTISSENDRMGYRLVERLEQYEKGKEMVSSGIIPGTIQITNEGCPIVLMRDAQTTGGYPRIANVVSEDINLLAQMRQGHEIKFMLVGLTSL